jgi:hypothetical protein
MDGCNNNGRRTRLVSLLLVIDALVTLLLSVLQVQGLVPHTMLQLHQQQAAVLGPIITLGSVELPDVAVLLSAYLGKDQLQQLVCSAESVKGHVLQALGQK